MKIFVAGGTGFVGSRMVELLCKEGHDVVCLARRRAVLPKGAKALLGDALDVGGLSEKLRGFDALINLIGIIREYPLRGITFKRLHVEATKNLLAAAKDAGIKRWLQMSANGARPDGTTYQKTKHEAEGLVKSSGLDWTIFRPSLIFGPPPPGRMEFCTQIAGLLKIAPVVPVFGDGNYLFQPVHVDDVGRSFAGALEKPGAIGKTFHLGSEGEISYLRILDAICEGMGKRAKIKLPVPWALARPFVKVLGLLPFFPATAGQIDMLIEGSTVPETGYMEVFNITPIPFTGGNLSYLRM